MATYRITTTSGTPHNFNSSATDPGSALDGLAEISVNGSVFYGVGNAAVLKSAVESCESV